MPMKTRKTVRAVRGDETSGDEGFDVAEQSPTSPSAPTNTTAIPAAASESTEMIVSRMMESFANMQRETNRTLLDAFSSMMTFRGESSQPVSTAPSSHNMPTSNATGNFSKCTARFNGSTRDPETVEAFIDAIVVYKECANVSDEHALRGLPMLLENDAAVWWRGARTTVATWEEAITRLRSMYGAQKPAYQILKEIFKEEQADSERAEVFITNIRSKLVRLPYDVHIPLQIDIIYGLLHRRVRKRLPRDTIDNIDTFIEKARVVEDNINELNVSKKLINPQTANVAPVMTSANSTTHLYSSRDSEIVLTNRASTSGLSVTFSNPNEISKRKRGVQCSFCKKIGHSDVVCRYAKKQKESTNPTVIDDVAKISTSSNNAVRCYGCGQSGVVRSKCERCNGKDVSSKSCVFNYFDDENTNVIQTKSHPTVSISIANTEGLANMEPPRNIKHLKRFLQTSRWFRRCIPNYAAVSAPLTLLLKKASIWKWGPEQREAFEKIKYLLISAPVLRQADVTKPFILRTDSSAYALGAALLQGEGTDERPVEYASRLLSNAERNYNTTEREALAVVWAVSKFRGYIDGAEVILKTDHQPLRWLMCLRSPSGRFARWAQILQEYDLKIEYTPGGANVSADTLSHPTCTTDSNCDLCLTVIDLPSHSPKDVRANQLKDPKLRTVMEAIESDDPFKGRMWADKGYIMVDGILYRYVPEKSKCIRRDGPYRIKESISDGMLLRKYHASLLTPFVGPIQPPHQGKRKRGRPRKANPASGT